MPSQKVNFVQYLAVCELDFSIDQAPKQIALIPKDAEVIHLSCEVLEAGNGQLDIGFEGQSDKLANDIDLSQVKANIANIAFTPSKATIVLATPQGGANSGKAKIRLGYFLPSTMTLEVNI